MCLIIFAYQPHGEFPLLLAANRDEFFSRPTQTADFWPSADTSTAILAGRDLNLGGTWLGISPTGRFAAVTNIRNPSQSNSGKKSRGFLVRDFLLGEQSLENYLQEIALSRELFAGFNLLLGDRNNLFYLNNLDGKTHKLSPGVYGLSNGNLDSPWPKIVRGKNRMRELMDSGRPIETQNLIDIMTNSEIAEDGQLPETGVSLELERVLSAGFINNPDQDYGTRCSTAIIVDARGLVQFYEQNYRVDASISSRKYFTFPLL